jgi:hypothetical protein
VSRRRVRMNRRQFLGGSLFGATTVLAGCSNQSSSVASTTSTTSRHKLLRGPGSRPQPDLPPGTDQVPEIEHIVVVMMENHSFDNILGLIGRGDGLTLGPDGEPTAKNPDGFGNYVHAFHMPTECQTNGVGNDWKVSHEAYDGGTCQGFVTSTTPEAMGYFTEKDLPFTCGMAKTFPSPTAISARSWLRRIRIVGISFPEPLSALSMTPSRLNCRRTASSMNNSTGTGLRGVTTTRVRRRLGCICLTSKNRIPSRKGW